MVFIHISTVQFLLSWSLNMLMSLYIWKMNLENDFFHGSCFLNETYGKCFFSVLLCFVHLLHDLNK